MALAQPVWWLRTDHLIGSIEPHEAMQRDVNTPLILWICAAVCAHYMFGQGGNLVGQAHDDKSAIWGMLVHARERVKMEEQTFEVAPTDPADQPPEIKPEDPKPDEPKPEDQKPEDKKDEPKPPELKKPDPPKPPPPPTATQKPPTPPKPKPEDKKKDEEKKIVAAKPEDKKEDKKPLGDPIKDKRIAVRQHAYPNQKDNPDAKFIADQV